MEQKQVNISIVKIKEIEFFVNESMDVPGSENPVITFELLPNINMADSIIELLLTAKFNLPEDEKDFLRIKTSNMFSIPELSDFFDGEKQLFHLPDNVMITLLSLSVSHTRALLAKNASGTKFADLYLPIINPTEIYKQLFGSATSLNSSKKV
jgi:hypothetical protein